jgi:hypothetical protein
MKKQSPHLWTRQKHRHKEWLTYRFAFHFLPYSVCLSFTVVSTLRLQQNFFYFLTYSIVIGKWCFQKILVLVLRMEESKQNTWMGWGRTALLREEESPSLPGEGRGEEEGPGSLGRSFLYDLELGDGETIHHHLAPLTCGLGGGTLEPREGTVPDYP